jgi:hypothetical protein
MDRSELATPPSRREPARRQCGAGTTFDCGFATGADDADLRRLLRETPMPGPIHVSFEREPRFFDAARAEGGRHHTICARDTRTGRLFAMASRVVRELYVNGSPARVGYLSQLRVAPGYRHLIRSLLRRGFQLLRETRTADESAFDITTIVDGNDVAKRVLEAGLTGLPRYTPVGRIVTLLIPGRKIVGQAPRVPSPLIPAAAGGAPALQFQPVDPLPGIWDQRGFKQVVVRGYAPWVRRFRWLLRLPPVGSVLPIAYLAGNPAQGPLPADCRWLVMGLSDRHPLLDELRRQYRPREYGSTLYVVHDPDITVHLDDRLHHVEVALL